MTRASDTRRMAETGTGSVRSTGSAVGGTPMRPYGSYKDILKPHPAFPLPFANRTPIRIRKDAA